MRTRLAAAVTSALLVAAGFRTDGAEAQQPPAQPPTREELERAFERQRAREAELYARERKIPLEAAERRLRWARLATTELVHEAERDLGPGFGGAWIDRETGRVKLGVTGESAALRTDARSTLAETGLQDGADLVTVDHSQEELDTATAWLAERLKQPNAAAPLPVQFGTRTDRNAIDIDLPRDAEPTGEQRAAVDEAVARFGDLVRVGGYAGTPHSRSCNWHWCDPPLRGGIALMDGGGTLQCTAGFNATGRGANADAFLMTAGHCRGAGGGTWKSRFSNLSVHDIGAWQNATFDYWGDAGILRVNNPRGWLPLPWVLVRGSAEVGHSEGYKIRHRGTSTVGMTVCTTGAGTGYSDCGVVTHVNASVAGFGPFMTRGNFCGTYGDSGGPMYKNETAYGIHVGGAVSPGCDSWYTERVHAENLTNTSIDVSPRN
jgi:streptogrisin C